MADKKISQLTDGGDILTTDDLVVERAGGNVRVGVTSLATGYSADSNKITDLLTPTATTDAANKSYVDSAIQGLDWVDSVIDEVDFTTAEPGSPTVGARYINTVTGTSSGTAQGVTANDIEEWNGVDWTEITPTEGTATWVEDINAVKVFNGSAWVTFGSSVDHANLSNLQGGSATERYHLTAAQHTSVTGVTSAEYTQLANIDSTTISSTQWGYVGAMDQPVGTANIVTFDSATVKGAANPGHNFWNTGSSADNKRFNLYAETGTEDLVGTLINDGNTLASAWFRLTRTLNACDSITFSTTALATTGSFQVNGNTLLGPSSVATTATDGFARISTTAGTPTGTPTIGEGSMVVDTTNDLLYFYSSGAWRAS